MNPNTKLSIATAPRRNSKKWTNGTITWGELIRWAENPADRKEAGNYLLGHLTGPYRNKDTVESRSGILLDADDPDPDFEEKLHAALEGTAYLLHPTYSSTTGKPRYRVVIPADSTMNAEQYHAVTAVIVEKVGIHQFDMGSLQAERYMFRPATQDRDTYTYTVNDGAPLSVKDTLRAYDPDLSSLPLPEPTRFKRDPFSLNGVVGAFNRAYDLETLIEAYDLPYDPSGRDRWQYRGAHSAAGMGAVADGLYYSHHANDPAGGETHSAFDLVRVHRFHHLDAKIVDTTPVNRRPSHKAMLDLAAKDTRVIAELVGTDFSSEEAEAVKDTDWRLQLRFSPSTGKFVDDIRNWDLVCDNDPVFQGLYFNELTMAVETSEDFPWRPLDRGGPTVTRADRSATAHHLEREYGVRLSRNFVDELLDAVALRRYVNPVREYLQALEWDGVPRVETCLPGVRPTPYTRVVARKVLVAAVARMLDPGCKWDHTLILFGAEGIGKSWWVTRMARGYSATLGPVHHKDTLLAMQRSWIMVSDEGHSLRRADADAQKEFFTRTADVYRLPYEREATVHQRHCVIWSTTNDKVLLQHQEGNRRYLIVHCEDKVDFDAMTDAYVDQLWAEALYLYRQGEPLYLDEEAAAMAAEERSPFTEEEALSGLIQEYLDTPVPAEWPEMSPDARVLWMQNLQDGMVSPGTERITEVCSMQVWVEVLERRRGEHRRQDLLAITKALRDLPGWEPSTRQRRMRYYGPQLVFRRLQD